MQTQANLLSSLARIESVLQENEELGDDRLAAIRSVVQDLLEYHRAVITQMLEMTGIENNGKLVRRWADDELVASMLLLYDLHPDDLSTRVERALEQVRPYLNSHGGNVALVGIEDGIVRLQMRGSCHGCPSSAVTLRTRIDEAICAMAPDAVAIEVAEVGEEKPSPAGFVPVEAMFGMNGHSTV